MLLVQTRKGPEQISPSQMSRYSCPLPQLRARELALMCLSFPPLHGNEVWVSLWRNVEENKWLQGCKGPEDRRWEAFLKGDESNDKILSTAKS